MFLITVSRVLRTQKAVCITSLRAGSSLLRRAEETGSANNKDPETAMGVKLKMREAEQEATRQGFDFYQ